MPLEIDNIDNKGAKERLKVMYATEGGEKVGWSLAVGKQAQKKKRSAIVTFVDIC